MKKQILAIMIISSASWASAQEVGDSVYVQGLSEEEILEITTPRRTESWDLTTPRETALFSDPLAGVQTMDHSQGSVPLPPPTERRYVISPHLNIYGVPKGSTLPTWGTGYVYGSNSHQASLLYGYRASASMGVYQQLGERLSVNGGVTLSKYSVYYNTAHFYGSATWRMNRYMDVTAFGGYMPGTFFSPIQIGPSFNWGGYLDLHTDTDVPFGVDLGANTTYDPFFGHETTPIVRPYVKVGGSKIGFDFGPMIRNAYEKSIHDNGGFQAVPKPVKIMPQVGPRR